MFVGEMGCWLVVGIMSLWSRYVSKSTTYERINNRAGEDEDTTVPDDASIRTFTPPFQRAWSPNRPKPLAGCMDSGQPLSSSVLTHAPHRAYTHTHSITNRYTQPACSDEAHYRLSFWQSTRHISNHLLIPCAENRFVVGPLYARDWAARKHRPTLIR